jgi:hypothetical protein
MIVGDSLEHHSVASVVAFHGKFHRELTGKYFAIYSESLLRSMVLTIRQVDGLHKHPLG